ncbi:MAG: response regulator [Gracilimonas sp.]|uniref:response regulator n=1 Tax=Gracilimonas sp. TaxID=1974203 RepID=UPI0019B57675|nr:response regulator [Gracilimonas sp.]MBD3617329.1 response regulator [Gracilimonas sp.]
MGLLNKVMIVEDDPLLSIVEEKMVIKLGYNVVGKAKSGEEALANIQDIDPEILIIDIQLAGTLDGIQTVKKLREKHLDIPVIFLSGDKSNAVLQDTKGINYIDFLLKPVTPKELSVPLKTAAEQIAMLSQSAA